MWDYMLDRHVSDKSRSLAAQTERDGRERAVMIDYMTGKTLGEAVGNEKSVALGIPAGKTVATLHTHPTGDNTPSPADILSGFNTKSKAEYIAAGKKLRRWTWLKMPEPEDARLIRKFDEDNRNGGVDIDAYKRFLGKLAAEGYIKMEDL